MSATIINGNTNISILDTKVEANLFNGFFLIDITPSVILTVGNIAGVKVQIKDPYDNIIKSYGSSYDILTPFTSQYSYAVPMQMGKYQFGNYKFEVELTEIGGTKKHINKKELDICSFVDSSNVCITLTSDCRNGKLHFQTNEPPPYKGTLPTSKIQNWLIKYPTGTIGSQTITQSNVSLNLFEGEYNIEGTISALYNFADNLSVRLGFGAKITKSIKCNINFECFLLKIKYYQDLIDSDCDDVAKANYDKIVKDALSLMEIANYENFYGKDSANTIQKLEDLLQCSCADCGSTSEIINNTPSTDVRVIGRNTNANTTGFTTTYEINNDVYVVEADPTQNIITVSGGVLNGFVVTQQLLINEDNLYASVKGKVIDFAEFTFWADKVKQSFIPSAPQLACLGLSLAQYNALDYAGYQSALLTKMCDCCGNATCNATISNQDEGASGVTTVLTWVNVSNVYSIDIYVDNNLVDNVLNPLSSYVLYGFNDGVNHQYKLVAKCSNGANGNTLTGVFNNAGCATILAPSLSSNNVSNAACPYNLTALGTPPVGFTYEWHNANNALAASLVPNPASVTSGTYFVFAKQNTTGCLSPSSQVIITCAVLGTCSEPLNLLAAEVLGGILVSFNSASTPPPSYLVKRRLANTPDVSGSYTTIGTPVFNGGSGKWEILDTTAAIDTLYVYMAESQCTDATRPNAQYQFAKIICPVITTTATGDSLEFSVVPTAGQIDVYDFSLYDSTGINLISGFSQVAPFSNPITQLFTGLDAFTTYKIQITKKIGFFPNEYSKACPFQDASTLGADNFTITNNGVPVGYQADINGTIFSTQGSIVSGSPVSGFSGAIPVSNATVQFILFTGTMSSVTLNGVPPVTALPNGTVVWTNITAATLNIIFSS